MNNGYIISFDWEELNSAVLRNAQIHMRKKCSRYFNEKIGAIVPWKFKALYSNADIVVVIREETLKRYRAEDYRKITESGWIKPVTFIEKVNCELCAIYRSIRNRIIYLSKVFGTDFINHVHSDFTNFIYSKWYCGGRQKRFFIDSGLESYCLKKIKEYCINLRYIRISDYFDVRTMSTTEPDLNKYFFLGFSCLSVMIQDRNLYSNIMDEQKLENTVFETNRNLLSEQKKYLHKFIFYKGPKIIIRTRNWKLKTVHNSKQEIFEELAKELVFQGVMVLNLGCPLLNLNVKNELYCEIDHNMPIEIELALCQNANAVAMTAESGLFTAFAASFINIIQIDDEWTLLADIQLELMKAREIANMKDIDVRSYIKNNDFISAVKCIKENLDGSNISKETSKTLYNTNKEKQGIFLI